MKQKLTQLMAHPVIKRLIATFELNKEQVKFGSYAAELSFYILWAFVPLILTMANVIAVIPFTQGIILEALEKTLPSEVQTIMLPMLKNYLKTVNSGSVIIGLLISLWPSSVVFNTMQRILNDIYKTTPRKNMMISRAFSYVMTFGIVAAIIVFVFALLFGQNLVSFFEVTFNIELSFVSSILNQTGVIGAIGGIALIIGLYHFTPNIKQPLKTSIPGTVFAFIGFFAISELFSLYLHVFGNRITSSQTIGIFLVLMIWLYFNAMVLVIGAYTNVFIRDYHQLKLEQITSQQIERGE